MVTQTRPLTLAAEALAARLVAGQKWLTEAARSRPPLIADRCLRTQLMSWMPTLCCSSVRVVSCLPRSVSPAAGTASIDDAPPESSTTKQSARGSAASASAWRPAAMLLSSGTG